MKIGILSDSHVYNLRGLPRTAVNILKSVDLIVHVGDYTSRDLVEDLRGLGNFKGVYGNMDPTEIREELPDRDILEFEGFRLGLIHPPEGGSPFDLEKRIKSKFSRIDAIIFGHTHRQRNKIIDGILYFNPGSITGRFPAKEKTFGILNIDKELKGKIIKL